MHSRVPAILATWAALAPAVYAQAPGDPEVQRPTGAYQHLWLDFAGTPAPAKAFLGLREGKGATAWFLDGVVPGGVKPSGGYRVLVDSQDISLTAEALRGVMVVRQVSIWAPMARLAQVTLTIDAKRTGDRVAGTWSAAVLDGGKATGELQGTVRDTAALRARQPFAAGTAWPAYHGPGGGNHAADSKAVSAGVALRAAAPVRLGQRGR